MKPEIKYRRSELRWIQAYVAALADPARGKDLAKLRSSLPESIKPLPDDLIQSFFNPDRPRIELKTDGVDRDDYTAAEYAAVLRGEKEHTCVCDAGYAVLEGEWDGHKVTMVVDDEVWHSLCHHLAEYGTSTPAILDELVPRLFRDHRVLQLTPWAENPIPAQRQEEIIGRIPSETEDLRGWLLVGPGGTSKTTYAAAAFTDIVTTRVFDNPRADSHCCYAITVPEWLDEVEAYKYRDYGSDRHVDPPSVTVDRIKKESNETGVAPCLWIEEIDKLKMTEPRRILLFNLINQVYKERGTIIVTSNMTLEGLREHLDTPEYPITRRFTGRNDAAAGYKLWDFWTQVPKEQKSAKKKSAVI